MAGQGIFWHTSYVMSSRVFIILVALTVISQHGISMYLSCWNDVDENTTEYLWEKSFVYNIILATEIADGRHAQSLEYASYK